MTDREPHEMAPVGSERDELDRMQGDTQRSAIEAVFAMTGEQLGAAALQHAQQGARYLMPALQELIGDVVIDHDAPIGVTVLSEEAHASRTPGDPGETGGTPSRSTATAAHDTTAGESGSS